MKEEAQERPRPSEPEGEPRLDVGGLVERSREEHRCPFCHEAVLSERQAWFACLRCGARHHLDCWDESRRCASCRHDRAGQPPQSLLRAVAQLLLVLLLLVAAGAVALRWMRQSAEARERAEDEKRAEDERRWRLERDRR